MQRQARILKEAGGSDEQFKEAPQKAGINISALEKEAKRDLEKQRRAFKELRKIEPPPPRAGELTGEPHVHFKGDVAMYADDHWYTNTDADLEIKLHFDL